SINFDLSVYEIFTAMSEGGKIILGENALELMRDIRREEVRVLNTVPSAMEELVRDGGLPEGVSRVNLAGEALKRGLVERVYQERGKRKVVNLYGPTEYTTYSTKEEVERGEGENVMIGRPIWNTRVYIADEMQRSAPVGVKGEILIGGGGLARGYM